MGRKTVDIEALLRWAYRDELPKAAAEGDETFVFRLRTGWGGVEKMGELLALVQEPDMCNRFGLFPDAMEREPHPDAVAVFDAVERLGELVYAMPEEWNPLEDLGDLGADGPAAIARGIGLLTTTKAFDAAGAEVSAHAMPGESGAVRKVQQMRRSPARIVIRHALLGGCPPWEAERPERAVVMHPMGRGPAWFRKITVTSDGAFAPARYEVEVDGFDYSRRRPYADAYQKTFLDPDPVDIVVSRAEYEIWHACLASLVSDLQGLSAHHVLPSLRAARPWEDREQGNRILPSLLRAAGPLPESRAVRREKKRAAT
ncbi:hypothetical protein [Xanthobacter flavus]|uniref:hypothetical protein n=1 Tax=Xanthobacter flavus TaxID=281 RepID=UPI001AEB7106|nr:hypothetical protein [Xanthobacter flavus]MBP2147945.1 hypothetical protein [Xanthobacter flavus]